jgi:hypothetical protein
MKKRTRTPKKGVSRKKAARGPSLKVAMSRMKMTTKTSRVMMKTLSPIHLMKATPKTKTTVQLKWLLKVKAMKEMVVVMTSLHLVIPEL